MTAISDYASLLEAVEDQLERTDLDDRLPRFVQMTEAVLRRSLRTLDMEVAIEQPVAAGEDGFDLPADCLALRAIGVKGEEGAPGLPLQAISPAAAARRFDSGAGLPGGYARIGGRVRLAPVPERAVTLDLLYLARFVPLTAASANWILSHHPDVYFYGVCAQALAWDRDEENPYAALFAGAVGDLAISRARDRWGPGLAIPGPVPTLAGVRA